MRKLSFAFILIFTLFTNSSKSQVTIASDEFENSFTLFTATAGSPAFYTGNSAAGDRPANSPFAFSNNYGCGVSGQTVTLTSGTIDVSTYSSIFLNLKLAAFSIGSTTDGLEINDFVNIAISPDNGANYYPTLEVDGYLNCYWSYTGGTATATTAYDGNQLIDRFNPLGSGARTSDGYSTLAITNIPQTPYLRIQITIQTSTAAERWLIDKFELKGTSVTGPLINVYPLALSGFSAVTGTPSAEQIYTVRGLNLTNDITINAPAGFEISQSSGAGFGSVLNLTPAAGLVPWTTIYTRMNSTTIGANSNNISHLSTGATSKTITVSGNVLASEPTTPPNVSFTNITADGMTINFSGGNGEGRIVVMRLATPVTASPTDGTNYSVNPGFGASDPLATGQYVVYDGTGNSVAVTNLSSSSIYYISVFEFNYSGINASRNYLTTGGTGNATTLVINEGLELAVVNTLHTIDFDNTVPRVNNGAFAGVDIVPVPSNGQINSNAWTTSGFTGGPPVFGGSTTTGKGVSTGNVANAGYYAFEVAPGNKSFGIQLTDAVGLLDNTLRIQNTSGVTITSLAIGYKVYILNNSDGLTYHTLSYSLSNSNYFTTVHIDSSAFTAEVSPTWKVYYKSALLNGLSVAPGSIVYLRWTGVTYSGVGVEADEIAWDDISIVANPTTVFPRVSGNVQEIYASGPIQLSGNTTVAGDVTLYGTNIELGNNNITIGGNAYSISSGYLQTNGTGAVTLTNVTTARLVPLGVTTYNPLIISNGSGLNWTFRLDNGISNVIPPNNTDKAVLRTWTITPSTNPPPAGANITFQYNDGDATQIGPGFNTNSDVQVWHNEGFGWASASGGLTPTGTPGGVRTVTLSNWSQYSSFAISNISGPLPVNFDLIRAKQATGGINVSWINHTETNILYYSIEHSPDGRIFSAAGRVSPLLNNGERAEYNWLHISPNSGKNFYRIVANEVDGKNVYSSIVRLNIANSKPTVLIYPNPVQGSQANLQLENLLKGNYELSILAINGQEVYKKSFSHIGGSVSLPLTLGDTFKHGIYVLYIRSENINLQTNFVY